LCASGFRGAQRGAQIAWVAQLVKDEGEVQPVGQIPGWQVEHTKDALAGDGIRERIEKLVLHKKNREGFGTLAKHGIDARGVRSPRQQIARADSGAQPVFHQAGAFRGESLQFTARFGLAKQGARFLHVLVLRGCDDFLCHGG
jgi:hypothetical protein